MLHVQEDEVMVLADMKQDEARSFIDDRTIALLPVGATEVHGDHLPLCTDVFLAEGVARKVAERLGQDRALVLPSVNYGQVWSLGLTTGTVDIPDDVLVPYLVAIATSMHRSGIRTLAFINAHVGNNAAIKSAMRRCLELCDLKTYSFTYPGAEDVISKVCVSHRPHKAYFHACEIETSYMLYLAPDKVDMSKAIRQYPDFPEDFDYTPTRWSELFSTAVLGDATLATAEKGRAIIDSVVDNIVHLLTKGE